MLLRKAILTITVIAALSAAASATTYPGQLGAESPGNVFVDMVKQNYNWYEPNGGGGWQSLQASHIDANGWPTVDARWANDYRPVAEWGGSIDDPEQYRIDYSGTYKCSFRGQGTVAATAGATVSSVVYDGNTNTTTFNMVIPPPVPHHAYFELTFTDTKRTPASPVGSGFTDLKVYRPGYPLSTTQVFTDEFITCLKNAKFSTVRFMGVAQTNGNVEWDQYGPILQHWSNRKKTTDASQTTIPLLNKKDGFAWEYIIQICNTAKMDMWLCVPASVDNNYVQQLAQLVYDNLDPNLNVYLEHSNEIWNWGFIQYAWNYASAEADVNAGGSNLNYDGEPDHMYWAARRHARRTMEIVNTFASVFGSGEINQRLRGILAGISANETFFKAGNLSNMLTYLNANYGPPSNYIYGIAITGYYGGSAASGQAGTENYTVQQIIDSMRATSDSDVPRRQAVINLATTWALPGGGCTYESGPDIGGGSTTNIGNRILAVRDPNQKDVYKRNFANNFWDLGGNLAMQFTLASSYNRYGAWGLTDDMKYPDRNYLFAAVRELLGNVLKQADFNLDWIVDVQDLDVMADDWMKHDEYVGGGQNPGTANLVARWKLDEGAGQTPNDSSGNGHNARLGSSAGADANDPAWFADAERGRCLYFDGNDYVFCGGGKNAGKDPCDPNTWTDPCTWADFNGGSFTLSCFIKQTDSLNWATFIGKGELEYKHQFGFLPWLERRIHFAFPRTPAGAVVSNNALANNVWHHVAVVWDANAEIARIYRNTVLDGTVNYKTAHPEGSGRFIDNDCDVLIGARVNEAFLEDPNRHKIGGCPCSDGGYATSFFRGYISDVTMYNRALTAAEIEFLAGGVYVPLESAANLYDEELPGFKAVNFRDFCILAEEWLQ